jgi:phosphonate transport system substrate-binding protein
LADSLLISSCMAPDMDGLCRDLADYFTWQLELPVHAVLDIPWQERERMLDRGQLDLCWLCGLPYVRKSDEAPGSLVPLFAPVMSAPRYHDRPVYFSDMVVHRDSPYQSLGDLQGASWAYNEPGSHSGYGVVRYALALEGKTLAFFGNVVESGAHQNSLSMILHRQIDASGIDSTVLELEIARRPEIAAQIRTIATFGPSPIPPWVITSKIAPQLRIAIANAVLQMHKNPAGVDLLRNIGIAHFTSVTDHDYDPIREMARIAFQSQDR